ncbi:MAG: monovalent cation/H+ antiporter complex subunit F [Planctomycetota bacterium]|jgi:multicomponent Na+:H+ antiporter subunit F|nr:monovalent cation/H+ antiporter complex subunit F [Planctomycetota bacterium]
MTLLFTGAWLVVAAAIAVAMALTTVRVLRGPTSADRIVCLDLLAVLLVGSLAVVSHLTGQTVLLDVALVITASAFAGTLAMAARIADDGRDQA